jgi:hypothetical protein
VLTLLGKRLVSPSAFRSLRVNPVPLLKRGEVKIALPRSATRNGVAVDMAAFNSNLGSEMEVIGEGEESIAIRIQGLNRL